MHELLLMQSMTEQQRMVFLAEMQRVRKDPTVAVLLAFFLGGFGAHRFYLSEVGLGILYLCFFWAVIPWIAALVECFLLPGRVRRYNDEQASLIAQQVRAVFPAGAAV